MLSWLMLVAGGASLSACLLLPPWREARELRQERAAAERRIAELERQLTAVTKQIEHLRDDPSYLERLSRKEFGEQPPGIDFTPVEVQPLPPDDAPDAAEAAPQEDAADALEQATQRSPIVSVFVLDETRPIVMVMSALLMLVALALLLRSASSSRP